MSNPESPEQRPPAAAAESGDVLAGRFRIERVLGRGGMGEVLLAHDTLLHRQVALKRVRADGGRDAAERRAAVIQEARRASQVSDRHIAAIHDVLDLGDEVLIVMEYVDGETLRSRLQTPMPMREFWDVSRQCVDALGAAHAHGVIHRDIKPENLMVTRGHEIKILDFGIAWRAPRAAGETAATETVELHRGPAGTPPYMAPEAHYGGPIDQRTDIFSLGAVFYEMLTARHPFAAETPERVIHRIMHDAPQPVSKVSAAVTPELSSVVGRMLERDPSKRFDSCADVRAALLAAKRASGAALTAEETLPMAVAGVRRSAGSRPVPTWVWVAASAVIVVGGITAWRVVAALPRIPAQRQLALLPPLTPGASPDFNAYALGEMELLSNRLMRQQDQSGFQMSTFGDSWDEKLATAADARKSLGANLVLASTLEQRENRLHARLQLLEPVGGKTLGERTVDVPVEQPFAFADSLHHAALSLLHLRDRPRTAQADLGIRGAGTLRFLLQGLGRRRSGENDETRLHAIADLEAACRTEPDPAVPRAWLAWAQLTQYAANEDSSWLPKAEASAREAVSLDSTRAEAHRSLASVLGYRKRQPESLEHWRVASLLDPTDDDAWYRWGRAWQRLGDADQERKVYEAAITRRPHCFKPRWWLASWDYRNGHIEDAIRDFEAMIRRSPAFATGYASLGGLLLTRGEYDRAIDTLRVAVALRPDAVAYSNLGSAYFFSGRLSQAVDAYNQAFQFSDADYRMWLNLGDAYFWLRNRPDQARDTYRQALRLGREQIVTRAQAGKSPDPMIPALLSTAWTRIGERDSARVMLHQALALDSLNSRVQYQAAVTYWELGERGQAMGWLRRAVSGGYSVILLRDSPVHRDWRSDPGFQALLASAAPAATTGSPGKGGSK